MQVTAPGKARHARRKRFYMARGITVLWIGVAALASCQRFRDGVLETRDIRRAEFAAYDACIETGGSWSADTGICRGNPEHPAEHSHAP